MHPEYSLKLAAISAKEVKTYGWTHEKSVICGYANLMEEDIKQILELAGSGGIFHCAQDIAQVLPGSKKDLQHTLQGWLKWGSRIKQHWPGRGGGPYLGVPISEEEPRNKAWSIYMAAPRHGDHKQFPIFSEAGLVDCIFTTTTFWPKQALALARL